MLIDIHLHLQDAPLYENAPAIMAEVRKAGISRLLCNGESPRDWSRVSQLAATYPEILPCFGIHPWFVHEAGNDWEPQLRDYLSRHRCAIGECGIDRWIEPRDESLQERIFRRHLQIAADLDLPIMIHVLRAWGWFMDILATESRLPRRMLLHSYGGSQELIAPLTRYGAFFSFSGNIFEPKRQNLRDVLPVIPRNRLLIETDAPAMLPPEDIRTHYALNDKGEKVNHPANLPKVYEGIAHHLRMSQTELEQQVERNANELLGDLL